MLLTDAERYPLDPKPMCISTKELESKNLTEWRYDLMKPYLCGAVCLGTNTKYTVIKASLKGTLKGAIPSI